MQELKCDVYASNVMSEPSHKSELYTQCLYGDTITYLDETHGAWIKVKNNWNGYIGWVLEKQFVAVIEGQSELKITQSMDGKIVKDNHPYLIPYGSFITSEKYIGNYSNVGSILFNEANIKSILYSYLNVPYAWGMLSHAGIDCSGLSQMLYRFFNIPLPHIAAEQCDMGTIIADLSVAQCGDLAYFVNEDFQISHVGILLSATEIIHATENVGRVVIDEINQEGIYSKQLGKLTHTLMGIRSYL